MRRTTTKNMKMGIRSSLQRLGRSICVFRDGGYIGMMIGSDHREGLEVMLEAEVSILII